MERKNLIHIYGFTSAIICICLLWPSINAVTHERQLAYINDVKCADSCILVSDETAPLNPILKKFILCVFLSII